MVGDNTPGRRKAPLMQLRKHWRQWRGRVARERAERLAAAAPVNKLDAYLDPDIVTFDPRATYAEWLERVALAHARRDAAVAIWGPDPLSLRSTHGSQTEGVLH